MKPKKVIPVVLVVVLLVFLLPVFLARAAPAEERPFEVVHLADTRYEEVSFTNEAQDIPLAGMLFLPDSDGPYPAAVMIHGSGTSIRDNGWYVTLAAYLQENGIAVLLPDKRGSVRSGGDWRTASFEDLATDTAAAVAYLESRADLPLSAVGIIGSSQGGQLSPVVAAQTPGVAFVVNATGAAVTIEEQLLYEENYNLREMGVLPGLSNLVAYPSAWSIRAVRQKAFWDTVGGFDPLPYWRQVEVPALVLYGAEDTNVPTARSAALLNGLGKDNIEVIVFEGYGHALEDPPGQGNRKIRLEALEAVRDFILRAE